MATDRYQGLRDALAAGPTEGPWAYEPHGDTDDYGVGVLWDEHDQPQRGRCEAGAMFVVDPVVPELRGQTNAAYIAAANPAAIRALLAERDALREALQWYASMSKRMGNAAVAGDSQAILALMKDIAVDYGGRARAALTDGEKA